MIIFNIFFVFKFMVCGGRFKFESGIRYSLDSAHKCAERSPKREWIQKRKHTDWCVTQMVPCWALFLPTRLLASGNRCLVKNANWILLHFVCRTASSTRVARTKKDRHPFGCLSFLEAPPRFGLGVEVLQTFALPLGHGAIFS